MKTVEIDFESSFDDLFRVVAWYRVRRLALVLLIWVLLVLVVGSIVIYGAGGPSVIEGTSALAMAGFLCLLPIVVVLLNWFVWRREAGIAFRSVEPTHVTFSEEMIRLASDSHRSETLWSRLNKMRETQRDLIFFPQQNVFFSIAKRFITEPELNGIRAIVSNAMGKRAKLFTK